MLNTIAFGFNSCPEVLEELEKRGIIKVIASDIKNYKDVIHYDTFAVTRFRERIDFNYHYAIPYSIYKKIYDEAFAGFCANFSRDSAEHGTRIEYHTLLLLFKHCLNYLYNMLVENKIDLVLTSTYPHLTLDYLLNKLAKALNIKCFFCFRTFYTTANLFWIVESLEDIGKFKHLPDVNHFSDIKIEDFYKINLAPSKKNRKEILNDQKTKRAIDIFNPYRKINLKKLKTYNSIIKKITTDEIPENFVYMPLHYQPEATIISQAPMCFDDQVAAIEYIASKLPKNHYLLVKEHFIQTFRYRDELTFKRLSLLDNVRFVNPQILSPTLIEKAKAVATVAGTVGIESLAMGKPVIYFGYPVYREFHGAFEFNDDINLEEIFNYKVDRETLDKDFNELMSKAYRGTCYPELEGVQESDYEKNIEATTNSWETHIKNNINIEEFKAKCEKMYDELRNKTYFEPKTNTTIKNALKSSIKEKSLLEKIVLEIKRPIRRLKEKETR